MPNRILIAVAALTLTCLASAQAQVAGSNSDARGDRERKGTMQIVKSCNTYTGLPGSFCWISESNLAEIPVNTTSTTSGSVNYYTQALGIIPNLVDSNVVLDAGDGNRAIGRCDFDIIAGTGLCVYTDGTGTLAGFSARLEITVDDIKVPSYYLTGPYVFKDTKKPAG